MTIAVDNTVRPCVCHAPDSDNFVNNFVKSSRRGFLAMFAAGSAAAAVPSIAIAMTDRTEADNRWLDKLEALNWLNAKAACRQ